MKLASGGENTTFYLFVVCMYINVTRRRATCKSVVIYKCSRSQILFYKSLIVCMIRLLLNPSLLQCNPSSFTFIFVLHIRERYCFSFCEAVRASRAYAFSLHAPPFQITNRMINSLTTNRPAQSVYKPPSPIESWRGAATSEAMNPAIPLNALLLATAVDERPTLASTM